MNLVERNMTPCVMLERTVAKDTYGGTSTAWVDGDTFTAAILLNSSSQKETDGVHRTNNTYTVTTHKETILNYHDSFRRISDGKIFRVISTDNIPPVGASFNMRQVTAEENNE